MAGLYLLADLTVGCLTLYILKRLLASSSLLSSLSFKSAPRLPLPPGPKGLPLVGNVADLPTPGTQEWMHWRKHKDLYGPISSVTVLGQTIVIINDHETAVEVLEKRSSVYSDRPTLAFATEMSVSLFSSHPSVSSSYVLY